MIDLRWYQRLCVSCVVCFLASILFDVFEISGYLFFVAGSFGWQLIDQIFYTIRTGKI